jgi:peptide/nickel transport system substrate-binding protein
VPRFSRAFIALLALIATACGRKQCDRCDTLVISATGEPSSVLPPVVVETVGRDISDQVFERLADLMPGRAPIDLTAYTPRLAERWERTDSLTWRFHLRPGARWSDGELVTAEDVVFSFNAFSDSVLDSPARPYLAGNLRVTATDPSTVVIAFARSYPEQLYDATYHVRIIPRHIWGSIPRDGWGADQNLARLIGSGPYKVSDWKRGQSLTLESSSTSPRPGIPRVIWRFSADPDAALDLVLSHEADLMEAVAAPARSRVESDKALWAVRYPSAAYGFLGYQVVGPAGPHPILGSRAVRRALNAAVDRLGIARAAFGEDVKIPPGPMSQLLWIWDDSIHTLAYDTSAASRLLDQAGWLRGKDGVRVKGGVRLAFDVLVPGTSPTRKQMAEGLQESWRRAGVAVSVTAVDFPVFQQRLGQGKFDSYIGAWLDEPSPRGLAEQWTRAGWEALNYGHYDNPKFDSLFHRAVREGDVARARVAWREAMDTLNADAPALFLYGPTNVAAVAGRVQHVSIDPYSWLSGLSGWSLAPTPAAR